MPGSSWNGLVGPDAGNFRRLAADQDPRTFEERGGSDRGRRTQSAGSGRRTRLVRRTLVARIRRLGFIVEVELSVGSVDRILLRAIARIPFAGDFSGKVA